ncbi:DUF2806 domain-containing protein, partial [Acidovorax sp. SUPP1855]|uniref:DUF2806 domain-containing protein n=1 Tax=Acidovorax sp. SUPP1855 TaxID=431774 RepID=UPI0024E079DB
GLQGPSCTQAQTAAGPHHAQTAAGAHSFLFGFVKHGVVRGSHKAALKMIGQRRNVEKAFEVAVQELAVPTIDSGTSSQVVDEISDDWLNEFESLAAKMSTEKMQNLFGKILAGEIRKPKSFSVRTITLMAQLDNDAAELFLRLCSMAVALKTPSETLDVRVLTLGGSAGQNDLAKYGLAFNKLTLLEEYGLIISDYNSGVDYRGCVPSGNTIHACIEHQGVRHVLLPRPERVGTEVRFPGVALTRAAVELFSIVTQVPFPEYTEAMEKYFQQHGFDLGIVP